MVRRKVALPIEEKAMSPAHWCRWVGIVAMMLGITGSAWTGERPTTALEAPAKGGVQVQYASLSLHFEANQGQADSQVQFLSHGRGYSLLLTPTEAVLALQQAQVKGEDSPRVTRHASREYNQAVLRMKLVGANSHPTVNGLDALPGKA